MFVIKEVVINSYRSIISLNAEIDNSINTITICGENNVGKTNLLRAINLFFAPQDYTKDTDRPILKQAQGGARIDPKINIIFLDTESKIQYSITRDFKYDATEEKHLLGHKIFCESRKKHDITNVEIERILKKIKFCFIKSININIPDLIEDLTNDVIDVKYAKSKFTESRSRLREAFQEYAGGLQDILDVFSHDISETFQNFKNSWDVKFTVPSSVDTFRDLISKDVELSLDDKGCLRVNQKGSGLQRLAIILLNFEILERTKNIDSFIVCIDEPDIYLHEGLQRKLFDFIKEKSKKNFQIFYTTHSNVFINSYSMQNILFLTAEYSKQYSKRKQKDINVVKTKLTNVMNDDGYEKICQHLGIEKQYYDLLSKNNIIVEGGCDKKYIEELGNYYGLQIPNIISVNGVSNVEKYLEFYNSYYKESQFMHKPNIKVLFDNDSAGRDEYKKIKGKNYPNINVCTVLIGNFKTLLENVESKNDINHEIEDFIFPEVICYLINIILEKRCLKKVKAENVLKSIITPAFSKQGILALLDNEKNRSNPQGSNFSLTSANRASNQIKEGLAGLFVIQGNKKLIKIIEKASDDHPEVKINLKKLLFFDNF